MNGPPGEGDSWLCSVVQNSSEIITIVDPDGTLRYANPAFERVLGYDPEEAIGTMNVLDHVHLDDLPHVLEETERALSEGGVVTNEVEYRFRHKDGSWRWMESLDTYLLDDPHVDGVVVSSRDVTERKEAEEALRRSEAEIFDILESITDAFFVLDREWRIAYVNLQAALLLNRTREDLIGEKLWDDLTLYPQPQKAMAEGETARFERYYPPLKKWLSVRAYPSESGLSVYLQDVTERKRAEERIRFQARLLDAVGEAVIAVDMDHKVVYWNRAAEGMYGWSTEEVMGRNLREMVVPEDSREQAEEIARQVRETGHWSGEFVVRRKDGVLFPVMASNTPIHDEAGNLVGVISALRDVTKRKMAEDKVREAEARYRSLVEQVPAVIYINPSDGSNLTLFISPQIEAMLGYTPKEWIATDLWAERIHPDDVLWVLAANDRSRESGEPLAEEYRLLAKDGSVVWVRDEAALLRDEAGEPLYWQGIMVNITERKRDQSGDINDRES